MSESHTTYGTGLIIRLLDNEQHELGVFWSKDNQKLRKYNNLPDQNPTKNRITVQLPDIYLPKGTYFLSHTSTESFTPSPSSRTILVQAPDDAVGVEGWRGNSGYAWAPVYDGFAQLNVGRGSWELHAQGSATAYRAIASARQEIIALTPAPQPLQREGESLSAFFLLPSLLSALLLLCILRPQKKWIWGICCGLFILPTLLSDALWSPSSIMLQAAGSITDPIDSLSLVASINPFSPHTNQFQYPEGVHWLRLGPAWIGYLPAILIEKYTSPLFAHNIGLAVWWIILGSSLYFLARSFRINTFNSILFACCAALSPILVDESDSLSMDRATLFLFPFILFSLQCVWMNPSKKNIRRAAIAIGASIHFQIYYAMYTAVCIPLLSLCTSIQKRSWQPIHTLARMAPLTFLLAFPALWVLQEGSMGSYAVDQIAIADISSIPQAYAQRFLESPDNSLLTQTPTQRLLSATKGALTPLEVWNMSKFWLPAIFVCFFYRPKSRALCIIILFMLVLSMGPVWLPQQQWSTTVLPYYYFMKWIPGFDQLKNVYRFGLICSLILPLPFFLLLRRKWAVLVTILYFSITTFPRQYLEYRPTHQSLSALQEGAVCFLPLGTHSPNWMIKEIAQHDLTTINPPSFEQGVDVLTPLYIDHPLLNQLALLSNHRDVDILHLASIDKNDIMALQDLDIRWFVLPQNKLLMHTRITLLLDTHLSRWSEDERYIIWTIPSL